MRKRLAPAACILAVLGAVSATALAGQGPPTLITRASSRPGLIPGFQPDVRDYVVRCANRGMHLRVNAASGTTLRTDGHRSSGTSLDRQFHLVVGEAVTIEGVRGRRTAAYHFRCLPKDFPQWRIHRSGVAQAEWYVTTPNYASPTPSSYVAIFDHDGVPAWWKRVKGDAINATPLAHGRLAWSLRHPRPGARPTRFGIYALDGSRVGSIRVRHPTADYHELRQLPNGDFLTIGVKRRDRVNLTRLGGPRQASVLDGVAEEVTPDGRSVWKWDSSDHINTSEFVRWRQYIIHNPSSQANGKPAYDLAHLNAVDTDGSTIVISSRQADAVYGVSKATGKVLWKLGGTHTPRSLRMVDGSAANRLFGGQHDVRVLGRSVLTVHDNRSQWPAASPRALEIRLLWRTRQARILEQITAPGLRSYWWGSARKLAGGDWVVSWGGAPRVQEITPAGGRVLSLEFNWGFASYRAIPIPPGRVSSAALRRGMNRMAARTRQR